VAINTNYSESFYVFLATDTTLSASTSLQTTPSLESAAPTTKSITGMIVETVLETYFHFNYGEIGIVMLALAIFMIFITLNN